MKRLQAHRDAVALVAGLVLPLAVAALLVPFRVTFAPSAAALVLIAVVVAVAANGSRVAGFVAAVSASLWFDFFLTVPYERFAMTHRPDIETAISLVIVGIAVTELAARNRHHHRVAVEETDYVGLVYYLAELVASGASPESVIAQASAELVELLHLRDCHYEEGQLDRQVTRIEHDGSVYLGESIWGVETMGLPGKAVELRVQSRGHELGRFVMTPTPGWLVAPQQILVAVAIADQAGAALSQHLRTA